MESEPILDLSKLSIAEKIAVVYYMGIVSLNIYTDEDEAHFRALHAKAQSGRETGDGQFYEKTHDHTAWRGHKIPADGDGTREEAQDGRDPDLEVDCVLNYTTERPGRPSALRRRQRV